MRPPLARSGFILRSALVTTLMTSEADVVTLTAPRGYGKTTTLAQWARMETAPVVWLRAGHLDNTPKTLLCRLADSMKRTGIMTAENVAFFQFMAESEAATRGAGHLAELIESTGFPLVLMIDNVHALRSKAVTGVVADLVETLDGRARIVFASHSTPRIRLPAVRADGRLLEITEEQLAFSSDEVARLMTNLGIDSNLAPDIARSTEGWPAAVFLAAMAARDGELRLNNAHIESHLHLAEFVRSEVIAPLSRRRRQFLTLVSPLAQMSGPLCDAVSGYSDSHRLLEALARDTHLIHHVDQDANWFVMNGVIRQALLSDLELNDSQNQLVQARAAEWYEANDMPHEAIEHARRAGDKQVFASLMERLIKSQYISGRLTDVLSWMKWLDENVALEDHTGLAAVGALVHVQEGNSMDAERWLDAAARGRQDGESKAVISLVRAAMTGSGVERMVEDIETALDAAGPGSRWLPAIHVVEGSAHMVNGHQDLAEVSFVEAAKIGLENQSLAAVLIALGNRALIAIGRGDWVLAETITNQALSIIDEGELDGYLASGLPLIAAARCARRDNDIARTQRLLTRASLVRPRLSAAMPVMSVQTLVEMAKVHVELSDVAGARPLIREADDILLQRPDLGVLPAEVETVKESLAGLGPGRVALPPLTKAELRLLPYLATHLSFPEIGEELFVSRHTVKSQATSIYRKLGSSTRSEAIAKSYDIGLLTR